MLMQMWKKGTPYAFVMVMQISTAIWGNCVRRFLKELKMPLSYDPAIPRLGMYSEEWKSET